LSENGAPAKFTIPKLPTKFSFGIRMANTKKIQTDTNQKYQIGIQLCMFGTVPFGGNSVLMIWRELNY
jgi:hypothetical protein